MNFDILKTVVSTIRPHLTTKRVAAGLAAILWALYKKSSTGENPDTGGSIQYKYDQSLTAAGKPAIITHRVIIEDSLANNEIMLSVMAMLNQQVVAWILNAVQLSEKVEGSKTVRDVLNTLATESLSPFIDSTELIAFDGVPVTEITDNITLENIHNIPVGSIQDIRMVGNEAAGAQLVDMELKSTRLLSTRVVEITLGKVTTGRQSFSSATVSGQDKRTGKDGDETDSVSEVGSKTKTMGSEHTIVIRIGVHLIPYFLTSTQMTTLLDLSNPLGTRLRWKKVLAGEISFFWDFILCFDLIDQYKKALQHDKEHQLHDILNSDNYKRIRTYAQELSKTEPHSNNMASSILIIDAQTMKNITNSSDLDLNNFASREKFFKQTMSLMLVVVDDMYNNVKIYYNALKMYTTCTYSMLNRVGQKSDNYDLKDILTAFGSNQNLRY